mmetsp:Transcript_14376/g.31077  ORF Transcript_14376/g.31077 Transcript_14376/m.31077 type:complete len:680 (-) Transcript_14376:443-2482(-)|eukprot:CAMPEP_0202899346 /NCGR_PEP_ID=MMETSP1392-20130828/7611_1 /ASSEMBLY_ACC=CAM_ASM_000868 /TAXON_ID=225041 /ORGANISM="Chlamydomonas chlamydogama, Strain SAG 11-48b" /LENGTH=679 /DNA_ID=CAMNT_0049585509 /DNA_START=1334 /DNA_END=3373 /DNA_ORIENTATION=-
MEQNTIFPLPQQSSFAADAMIAASPTSTDVRLQQLRKRPRSPIDVSMSMTALSDPDIDLNSAHAKKRYLSEVMSSGLTKQMTLESNRPGAQPRHNSASAMSGAASQGSPADGNSGGEARAGRQASQSGQTSSSNRMCSTPDSKGPSTPDASLHEAPEVSSALQGSPRSPAAAPPTWPPTSPPPLPPSTPIGPPASLFLLDPNQGSAADARNRRVSDNWRSSTAPGRPSMRSTSQELPPPSPSDARFGLDLRKTALLRSLLMRVDEGGSSGGAPASSACGAYTAGMPSAACGPDPLLPDAVVRSLAKGQASEGSYPEAADTAVSRSGVGTDSSDRNVVHNRTHSACAAANRTPSPFDGAVADAMHLDLLAALPCTGPVTGRSGGVRGSSPMRTRSRSDSLMDTANSMDTSSTSGSAEEVEQIRRSSIPSMATNACESVGPPLALFGRAMTGAPTAAAALESLLPGGNAGMPLLMTPPGVASPDAAARPPMHGYSSAPGPGRPFMMQGMGISSLVGCPPGGGVLDPPSPNMGLHLPGQHIMVGGVQPILQSPPRQVQAPQGEPHGVQEASPMPRMHPATPARPSLNQATRPASALTAGSGAPAAAAAGNSDTGFDGLRLAHFRARALAETARLQEPMLSNGSYHALPPGHLHGGHSGQAGAGPDRPGQIWGSPQVPAPRKS